MNDAAVISADYVDLKFIKSRKVCQIVVEIDIDHAQKFVAAFGTPNPATGVPVALARIDPNAKAEPVKGEKPKRQWGELSRAEQAGIACSEMRFWRFLSERARSAGLITNADEAAIAVRTICGVNSRANLDTRQAAALAWDSLYSDFQYWLHAPEVVG